MKREKIIVSWLMLLAVMMLTVGCSDDSDERTASGSSASVELVPYASSYTEVEPLVSGTRAPSPPSWAPDNFFLYGDLTGVGGVLRSNEHAPISVYFTKDGSSELLRRFTYGSSNGKWRIDEEVAQAGNYYLYGFVPSSAGSASIYPNSIYADGAVLTLTGLNSVMTQDLCFVVGAKHGKVVDTSVVPDTESEKVALGDFECNIKAGDGNPNYIFLLFDHLYAALRFRFRVDTKYAALRAIKLKKLELLAFQDEACTQRMSKKVQTTVTLRKTTNGTSPIVSISNFTTDNTTPGGGADMDWALICDNVSEPILLPSGDDYTDNLGFVPKTSSYYHLRSTYDVYDLDADGNPRNLVRQNCVAENKIDPRKQFNQPELDRGKMYTLKFTVNPTYLYVLSEPDLDNPTMELE